VLDTCRGICALLVALFHFPVKGTLFDASRGDYLFVDFFFVLSGFVICHAYRRRLPGELASFVLRRVGRLWPLHLFALALLAAIHLTCRLALGRTFGPDHTLASLPANLFLLQGLGTMDHLSWNVPSWSISVEFCLYLGFALLAALPRGLFTPTAAALAGLGLALLVTGSPTYMDATYHLGLARGAAGFFAGTLVHGLWRRRSLQADGPAEALTAILVAAFVALAGRGPGGFFSPLVFGLTVYVFADGRGPISRTLSLKPLRRLGEWSYSIYMLHWPLIVCLMAGFALADRAGPAAPRPDGTVYLLEPAWASDLLALGYLAAVVCASALTYRRIEAPGRRLFARLAARLGPAERNAARPAVAADAP